MSQAAVVISVMICLLIGIASFLFMREKPQKKNEKITEISSEPTKVFDDCSESQSGSSDTIKWSAFTPKKMMSKAEYEEQGVIETNKAMEELRKIIENSQNPVKTFMKFGGETRAKVTVSY